MANIEFINNPSVDEATPALAEVMATDTELKNWLVDYVGDKHTPESGEVTVQMVVEVMATEFPEFLVAVAEENWVRGYQQAIYDVEEGEKLIKDEMDSRENEQNEGN
jgi:hypothetical protein